MFIFIEILMSNNLSTFMPMDANSDQKPSSKHKKHVIWMVLASEISIPEHEKIFPHQLLDEKMYKLSCGDVEHIKIDNYSRRIKCIKYTPEIISVDILKKNPQFSNFGMTWIEDPDYKLKIMISNETMKSIYLNHGCEFVNGHLRRKGRMGAHGEFISGPSFPMKSHWNDPKPNEVETIPGWTTITTPEEEIQKPPFGHPSWFKSKTFTQTNNWCKPLIPFNYPKLAPICDADDVVVCDRLFYGSGLTRVPWWLFCGWNNCRHFKYVFENSQIEIIEDGLFKNNRVIEQTYSLFKDCKKLQTIPNLFSGCIRLSTDSFSFQNSGLKVIPKKLFKGCKSLEFILGTFSGCKNIDNIPQELFYYCTKLKYANVCFKGTGIQSIPENLFANNKQLEDLSMCFQGCESLTQIPEDFTKNNTKLIEVSGIFMDCTWLRMVPGGLFKTCEKLQRIDSCFKNCIHLVKIYDVFVHEMKELTSAESVFQGCIRLSKCDFIIFQNKPKLMTIKKFFKNCNLGVGWCNSVAILSTCPTLRNIEGLFQNNENLNDISYFLPPFGSRWGTPKRVIQEENDEETDEEQHSHKKHIEYFKYAITNASKCFKGCYSLSAIPENLFADCPELVSTRQCFMDCPHILILPSNLFINNLMLCNISECFRGCSRLRGVLYYPNRALDAVETIEIWDGESRFIGNHRNCFKDSGLVKKFENFKTFGFDFESRRFEGYEDIQEPKITMNETWYESL
jgi:hypothetical protein